MEIQTPETLKPSPSGIATAPGIMQNSICNLNVFILRYAAGAIFIFTENEGFTYLPSGWSFSWGAAEMERRILPSDKRAGSRKGAGKSVTKPMSNTAINFPILLSV